MTIRIIRSTRRKAHLGRPQQRRRRPTLLSSFSSRSGEPLLNGAGHDARRRPRGVPTLLGVARPGGGKAASIPERVDCRRCSANHVSSEESTVSHLLTTQSSALLYFGRSRKVAQIIQAASRPLSPVHHGSKSCCSPNQVRKTRQASSRLRVPYSVYIQVPWPS
jgi:hypothetical protein